jgi:hypothetical protein
MVMIAFITKSSTPYSRSIFSLPRSPPTRYPKLREQLLGLNDSLDQGERQ